MTRYLLAAGILLLIYSQGSGQKRRTEDVLTLKNGWILRGKMLDHTDSTVRIQTRDGNIFVFPASQVDRMTSEPVWELSGVAKKGLRSFTEMGPLIAGKTSINGVTTAAFSFQSMLGYSFNPHLIPGVGLGADLYATQTLLPVFGSIRGDLGNSGTMVPYYFADLGYGINITQKSTDATDFKGGWLYAAGLGIKIPFNRAAGFLLSLAYRYQATSYQNSGVLQKVDYSRLALRAGFYF